MPPGTMIDVCGRVIASAIAMAIPSRDEAVEQDASPSARVRAPRCGDGIRVGAIGCASVVRRRAQRGKFSCRGVARQKLP